MNRVVWLLVFALVIPPCIPPSSEAEPLSPASVSREGAGVADSPGMLLLARRDYRDRYEIRREIRKDIRRHYRRKRRRAAVAGAIIGGVVVGGIVAERARRRRAYEEAMRDHYHHHHHPRPYNYNY